MRPQACLLYTSPGASIVGFPNANGLYGFESTAILTEGSPLQESYDKLFAANDRDFLKKEQELKDKMEETENEIEDILGEYIFEQ